MEESKKDGNGNGNGNEDEDERQLKELFSKFDTSKDGQLDRTELREAIKHFTKMAVSDEEVEKVIELADLDGSGTISFDEFSRFLKISAYIIQLGLPGNPRYTHLNVGSEVEYFERLYKFLAGGFAGALSRTVV